MDNILILCPSIYYVTYFVKALELYRRKERRNTDHPNAEKFYRFLKLLQKKFEEEQDAEAPQTLT